MVSVDLLKIQFGFFDTNFVKYPGLYNQAPLTGFKREVLYLKKSICRCFLVLNCIELFFDSRVAIIVFGILGFLLIFIRLTKAQLF